MRALGCVLLLVAVSLAPAGTAASCIVAENGVTVCDLNGDGVPDAMSVDRVVWTPVGAGGSLRAAHAHNASAHGVSSGSSGGASLSALGLGAGAAAGGACGANAALVLCGASDSTGRASQAHAGLAGAPSADASSWGDTTLDVVGASAGASCERSLVEQCHRAATSSSWRAYGSHRWASATYGPGPYPALCVSGSGLGFTCYALP